MKRNLAGAGFHMTPGYKVLFIFFFLSLLQVDRLWAQPTGMRHGPGMEMRHWRGEEPCWRASDLNLSLDQVRKLELIQQTYHRETQNLRTELISKRLELRESLTAPGIKPESIRSKYLAINELQTKLEDKSIEYLIKVRNLLTEEQLKIWCPEQEFPFLRGMLYGFGLWGPPHPRRFPPPERPGSPQSLPPGGRGED